MARLGTRELAHAIRTLALTLTVTPIPTLTLTLTLTLALSLTRHAILRSGLKNASNTKLMTAGAAYGPGIYLSTDASMSMQYAQIHPEMHHGHGGAGSGTATNGASSSSSSSSSSSDSSNAFLAAGANLKILALCEVAEVPTLR